MRSVSSASTGSPGGPLDHYGYQIHTQTNRREGDCQALLLLAAAFARSVADCFFREASDRFVPRSVADCFFREASDRFVPRSAAASFSRVSADTFLRRLASPIFLRCSSEKRRPDKAFDSFCLCAADRGFPTCDRRSASITCGGRGFPRFEAAIFSRVSADAGARRRTASDNLRRVSADGRIPFRALDIFSRVSTDMTRCFPDITSWLKPCFRVKLSNARACFSSKRGSRFLASASSNTTTKKQASPYLLNARCKYELVCLPLRNLRKWSATRHETFMLWPTYHFSSGSQYSP